MYQRSLLQAIFLGLLWCVPVLAVEVPRDRLVSDKELLSLLDPEITGLQSVFEQHKSGDTQEALKLLTYYFKERSDVSYYFHHADVRQSLDELKERYPNEVARIRTDAENFMQTYSADVDWRIPGQDLQGRPHTPNTIRHLSRQRNANDIVLHGFLNDDPGSWGYIKDHIRDFADDFEAGLTQTGANHIFERFYAGLRARKWLGTYHFLLATPEYDWQDQLLMIKLFVLHAAQLYDSGKDFNWGNHQLVGLTGVFEITAMFPEFPIFREWNDRVLEVILEHLEKEIEPDGFQFERASHYHKRDIFNYFRVYRMAMINDIAIPPAFHNRFRLMFDALVSLSMPSGVLPVMHDVTTDLGTMVENISNEMSLGALLFNEPVYRHFAAEVFPPVYYWLFDGETVQSYDVIESRAPDLGSTALPYSHFYVMRSGWKADDLYLQIDAGLARHKPDHTHGQVLGVTGYAFGEQLLPNYKVAYRERSFRTLKNSYVKSVALANNMLQGRGWIDNKARTGFGMWALLPAPSDQKWLSGDKFDYFSASHDGFAEIDVSYKREVFFFKPAYWVFIDSFNGNDIRSYQQIWQGSYELDEAGNTIVQRGERGGLYIRQADPTFMQLVNRRLYGTESAFFEKKGVVDHRFTTLVYPFRQEEVPDQVEIREYQRSNKIDKQTGDPFFRKVVITDGNQDGYLYFSDGLGIDLERIASDGQFVLLAYTDQMLDAALMYHGKNIRTDYFEVTLDATASAELTRSGIGQWQIKLLDQAPRKVTAVLGTAMVEFVVDETGIAYTIHPPDEQ